MSNDTDAARVEELARTAVDKAVAEDRAERRGFTITKFGRHETGYFHARVTIDGQPFYLHRRFGSWMAPGEVDGARVMKEVEGIVLGTSVQGRGKEIKEALQQKARATEKAERRNDPDQEEDSSAAEEDDATDDAAEAGDTSSGTDR